MSASATGSPTDPAVAAVNSPNLDRYLDAASGLPMTPATQQALNAAWGLGWADASRRYPSARQSRRLLDSARNSVAEYLGITSAGIFFLPDFAAAFELAISGYSDRHIAVNAVEDAAILQAIELRHDSTSSKLSVSGDGHIDVGAAAHVAHREPTAFVVQDVNLEIGCRQPLKSLAQHLDAESAVIVDARATLGRDRVSDDWDLLISDPRMWGGPPGSALLAVRAPERFPAVRTSVGGFGGLEPASPPVPLIAAAALALEAATPQAESAQAISTFLRSEIIDQIQDCEIVGHPESSFITMFSFLYVAADELIDELAQLGWSCASGASCTSDTQRPHHVLTEVGASSHGSLRVSVPPQLTENQAAHFVSDLTRVVAKLRLEAGAPNP